MRILLVLLLLPVFLRAQCPDPDSIIRQRNGTPVVFPGVDIYPPYTPMPIPPIIPPIIPPYYPFTPITSFVWVISSNGKMPLPPVNQDLPMGAKKWLGRGYCQVYYPDREDSVLLAKGRYLNRKKTGTWTWYYEDESKLCEGKYVNGLKTGVWTEYNSEEVSTGSFVAGRKEGVWKTYQQNDTGEKILLNTGTYHQGLSHGTWIFYENGVKTEKQTTAFGIRHGKTIGYYGNGKIASVENYVRGTQVSAYQYDEYGRITEISHPGNDTRTEIYYEEGRKQISHYKNGSLNGWRYIYAGQQLVSKEYFLDGMRHGPSMVINDDEKTVSNFRKDLQHGSHVRYKKTNGQWMLVEKTNYSHGMEDGNRFDLAYDGSRHYCGYKSGALHGREYWLGKKGDTLSSVVFKDGAEQGRKISVNGTSKTIAYYHQGKLISESKYESGRMEYQHFFRNGHPYEISQTKPLPGNRLREEVVYADGTLRNVRIFSAEGKDTVYTRQYFANGKLQSTETKVNGKPDGENMVLNTAGDTLSYNRYLYGRLEGRHIETSSISSTRTMVYKSHYYQGMRNGAALLYAVDSITEGKKTTSIALFASGNMYKNQPFGHWNLYFYNGALKYDGCLCGVSVTESPRYPAYDPELNVRPVLLMNNSIYCGDYLLYHPNGVVAEKRQGDVWEQYDERGVIKPAAK